MALIKCVECEKEVSDTAKVCPHCGYDLKKKNKEVKISKLDKKKMIIIIVALVLVILIGIGYKMLFPYNGKANKIMDYLEDEGYTCKKVDVSNLEGNWNYSYECSDKKGDLTATYYIDFDSGLGKVLDEAYDAIFNGEDFDLYYARNVLKVKAENGSKFSLGLDDFKYFTYFDLSKKGEHCTYLPQTCDDPYDCDVKLGKEELEPWDSCDYVYYGYTDSLNKILKEARSLIKEFDLD